MLKCVPLPKSVPNKCAYSYRYSVCRTEGGGVFSSFSEMDSGSPNSQRFAATVLRQTLGRIYSLVKC